MTTINQLSAVDAVASSDQVPIYSNGNGDARKASMSVIKAYVLADSTVADDKVTQWPGMLLALSRCQLLPIALIVKR